MSDSGRRTGIPRRATCGRGLAGFHVPVGDVVGGAECAAALGGGEGVVAVEGGAVGVLDGAEPGGEAGPGGVLALQHGAQPRCRTAAGRVDER